MKYLGFTLFITCILLFSCQSFKGDSIETNLRFIRKIAVSSGSNGLYVCDDLGGEKEFSKMYVMNTIAGDRFRAQYDSKDSNNIRLIVEEPIFLESESTSTTKAEVVRTVTVISPFVEFEYL